MCNEQTRQDTCPAQGSYSKGVFMKRNHLLLLLALTLPLVACNGDEAAEATDSQLENTVENTAANAAENTVEAAQNVEQVVETAAANVANQLETLNFEEASKENLAEVQNAVASTRQELAAAYQNADEQAQETWSAWSQDLEEAEVALENGADNALENAQNLLENIQNNIGS